MDVIATLPYIITQRTIEWNQQHFIKSEHSLSLYHDKVVTKSHSFSLKDVHDISYKSTSSELRWLYLHTNQGVFSYHIHVDPDLFIEEYKNLK